MKVYIVIYLVYFIVTTFAQTIGDTLCTTDGIRIRESPCTGAVKLVIAQGSSVTFLGESNTQCDFTWLKIFHNKTGVIGWSASAYLKNCGPSSDDGPINYPIYGPIPTFQYVSGRFNPQEHELFTKVLAPKDSSNYWLRKEATTALRKLYSDFTHQTNITWNLVSSVRNFASQNTIWTNKYNNFTYVPPGLERCLEILKYSSMPGTSRHHWGTDIDIYSVDGSDFAPGTIGQKIHDWLTKNGRNYGFCQPYSPGRTGGYYEEPWHWSYFPLSNIFIKDWNLKYSNSTEFKKIAIFPAGDICYNLAPTYVNVVNQDCL